MRKTGVLVLVFLLMCTGYAWALSEVSNFPNPFNPLSGDSAYNKTIIAYTLEQDAKVTIYIYSTIGDLVRTMEFVAGSEGGKGNASGYKNRVIWNGRNGDGLVTANGTYICKIVSEPADGGASSKAIRKITVLK